MRLPKLLLAAVLALSLGAAAAARAETLKIAHSIWVGYGPLYIAQSKGFFHDEGVDVELIVMDDVKLRFGALAAGRLDAMATTVDAPLLYTTERQAYRYLFALDDSKGGDGVVADKAIANIAGLKGKQVAFSEGSVSEFYLATLLKGAGLKLSDVQGVNMTSGDAGSAFVAGRVDAAVTWEPWLTRGKKSPRGHLLTDSSATPGLITDVLVVPADKYDAHKDAFMAVYRAWVRAVAFMKSNPDEAMAMMAKGVGGWLKDPKDFAETMQGVSIYDAADNRAFIGTAQKPGPILQTIGNAADLWSETNRLRVKIDPVATVMFDVVNQPAAK